MGKSDRKSCHKHHNDQCKKKKVDCVERKKCERFDDDCFDGLYAVTFDNPNAGEETVCGDLSFLAIPKSVAFYKLHADGTANSIDSAQDGPLRLGDDGTSGPTGDRSLKFVPFTPGAGVWKFDKCSNKLVISIYTFTLPLIDLQRHTAGSNPPNPDVLSTDCDLQPVTERTQNVTRVDLNIDACTLKGQYVVYSVNITQEAPCTTQDEDSLFIRFKRILAEDPCAASPNGCGFDIDQVFKSNVTDGVTFIRVPGPFDTAHC